MKSLGRRADGYHRLQTAFQFIDLCDRLRFWRRPPGVVERVGDPAGIPLERDLTLRAAAALAGRREPPCGVAIELLKMLPVQGGVGGGSSDAATVLVALNELWGLGLKPEALASIGLSLGADVPVFVLGRSAWAEGVGEHLTPVDFPEPVYLLIQPDAQVSTSAVFETPELTRDSPELTIPGFLRTGGRNDCEAVVRRRFPEVAEALDWLGRIAPARLTGTGSCVFAAMPDEASAHAACARVPRRWTAWVVRGLNRSPLAARLQLEHDRTGSGR